MDKVIESIEKLSGRLGLVLNEQKLVIAPGLVLSQELFSHSAIEYLCIDPMMLHYPHLIGGVDEGLCKEVANFAMEHRAALIHDLIDNSKSINMLSLYTSKIFAQPSTLAAYQSQQSPWLRLIVGLGDSVTVYCEKSWELMRTEVGDKCLETLLHIHGHFTVFLYFLELCLKPLTQLGSTSQNRTRMWKVLMAIYKARLISKVKEQMALTVTNTLVQLVSREALEAVNAAGGGLLLDSQIGPKCRALVSVFVDCSITESSVSMLNARLGKFGALYTELQTLLLNKLVFAFPQLVNNSTAARLPLCGDLIGFILQLCTPFSTACKAQQLFWRECLRYCDKVIREVIKTGEQAEQKSSRSDSMPVVNERLLAQLTHDYVGATGLTRVANDLSHHYPGVVGLYLTCLSKVQF